MTEQLTNNEKILFRAINERALCDREEGDQAYFNGLLLKLEFITKVMVVSVVSCLVDEPNRYKYTLLYELVRANSLGDWNKSLQAVLTGPPAQALAPDARNIVKDLTQKISEGDWRYSAVSKLTEVARKIGLNDSKLGNSVALREFFNLSVQIRNRTRGHGAQTSSQCTNSCILLNDSIDIVIQNAELFKRQWCYLHKNLSGKYRVTPIMNGTTAFERFKSSKDFRNENGVYFSLDSNINELEPPKLIHIPLIYTDTNILDIFLPNGNFKKNEFETISYVTNTIEIQDGSLWSNPPDSLPESETEGRKSLDVVGNIFTNSPGVPADYISRNVPEDSLNEELNKLDHHPIITLIGPGGIGKTSIALAAIQRISRNSHPPFETVLWISARDIDLLDVGPKPVSRHVYSKIDISKVAVDLLDPKESDQGNFDVNQYFQKCLREGAAGTTLFVIDNFETLNQPIDVFKWLDTHIRLPNKVLITTRFRDFHGDFPISIRGMSEPEANDLIDNHTSRLGIQNLLNSSNKQAIISESEGHPYVIKILLAEIRKGDQFRQPKRVFASSDEILEALFERTYMNLSPASQRTFLLLCSWRVPVPELAVEAVSLKSDKERIDVSEALDELYRFSLIERLQSDDKDLKFVQVPLAATIYGQKELKTSPYKFSVEEGRQLLIGFGASGRTKSHQEIYPKIKSFFSYVAKRANENPKEIHELKPILEYLAKKVPKAYLLLVELNAELDPSSKLADESKKFLRNYIQSDPTPLEKQYTWKRLWDLCRSTKDIAGEFHALDELAGLVATNHEELGEIANSINSRIRQLKLNSGESYQSDNILLTVESVAELMEVQRQQLTATNCSRLAWLYMHLSNKSRALEIAKIGINQEPTNEYCKSIIDKLTSEV